MKIRYLVFALIMILVAGCKDDNQEAQLKLKIPPGDTLPSELVGQWATKDTTMTDDGNYPVKGAVIYLLADGNGGIMVSPPPLALNLDATFEIDSNTLILQAKQADPQAEDFGKARLKYDPNLNTKGFTINCRLCIIQAIS